MSSACSTLKVAILSRATGSSNCNTFQSPALNYTVLHDEICPFGASLCRPEVGTLTLDTGFLSSHTDLGINAAKADRLWYRKVLKCTVLNDTKETIGWMAQSDPLETGTQPTLLGFGPLQDYLEAHIVLSPAQYITLERVLMATVSIYTTNPADPGSH